MPYLQLDVPGKLDVLTRRRLAGAISACYASAMEIQRHVPAVSIRCNDGGPWRRENADEMFRYGRIAEPTPPLDPQDLITRR